MSKPKRRLRAIMTPAMLCPFCGQLLDAAGTMSGRKPTRKDFTVCIGCARVLGFDAALRVRRLESGELEAVCAEQPEFAREINLAQRAIVLMHLKHPEEFAARRREIMQ